MLADDDLLLAAGAPGLPRDAGDGRRRDGGVAGGDRRRAGGAGVQPHRAEYRALPRSATPPTATPTSRPSAITAAFSPTIDVLSTLATALVIGYGGYLVFHGSLTVGVLAAFLIYVQQFFRPIQLASQVYTQLQSALAGGERIYAILDEEPEPADPPGTPDLGRVAGEIAFEDVTFAYDPGQPGAARRQFADRGGADGRARRADRRGQDDDRQPHPPLLRRDRAARCRSTAQDVRAVTRRSLRRQIAIVLQEPFLFSGTIAENIAYGDLDATRERIEAAARAVDAHDFIAALPEGYDTVLGEGGGTLSQGQRQLLAFARAVLAEPRILILDEATSNIDTRTEATIQRALGTLLAGRTSVVIAHRLSTIRNADLILVVEGGAHRRARHARRADARGRALRRSVPAAVPRPARGGRGILTIARLC